MLLAFLLPGLPEVVERALAEWGEGGPYEAPGDLTVRVERRPGLLTLELGSPGADDPIRLYRTRSERRPAALPDGLPWVGGVEGIYQVDADRTVAAWPAGSAAGGAAPASGSWGSVPGASGVDALLGGPSADPSLLAVLSEALEGLVRTSVTEGWEVVDDQVMGGALSARMVTLERDTDRRVLTLSTVAGDSNLLFMESSPGRTDDDNDGSEERDE